MKIVLPTSHCKWWAVNPAIMLYVDSIIMPSSEYEKIYEGKNQNTYHMLVYKTISLLKKEGVLEITNSYFSEDEKIFANFKRQVKDLIGLIKKDDKEKLLVTIKDLIFAYEYWISYNQKKLQLLDKSIKKDSKYIETILKDMNIWEEDLKVLKKIEYLLEKTNNISSKLIDRLKIIFDITLSNILTHVYIMVKNAELHQGSAFESLREYEPFFKYIIPEAENIHALNEEIFRNSLVIKFPVVGIKQKNFLQEISDTIRAYMKIRKILKKFEGLGWDFWIISEKYDMDDVKINKKILTEIRKRISFSTQLEARMEILDSISIMLGTLGFSSIPFNQILSGVSLFLALGTKVIAESLKIRTLKNTLRIIDEVKNQIDLKKLSVYFSLLDGVIVPIFFKDKEKLLSKSEDLIKTYIPKHWRRKDG